MESGLGTPAAPLRADPDAPPAIQAAAAPAASATAPAGDAGGRAPPQPVLARDTVTLPAGGYLRLRWIVDNPGAWLTHCHIDWHLYVGLGFVMRDGI